MASNVLLTAGIGEVLGFLVPIIFFVIYALNQVLSAKGKAQQQQPGRGQQRRAPQPRPARAPQRAERPMRPAQPQGKPEGGAAQLNSEIERFLRRASQRRPEQPTAGRAARAPSAAQAPPKAPPRRERAIDVVPLEPRDFDNVAASVEKHMDERVFSQRAEHMADDIARGEQQMEEHLQKAFGRRVGTLEGDAPESVGPITDVQTAVVTAAPSAAAAFAELLRTPQGMRQAIVLGEILAPPRDRW